jgi:hypothetical protein
MDTQITSRRRIAIAAKRAAFVAAIALVIALRLSNSAHAARTDHATREADTKPPVVNISSSISATPAGTSAVFSFSSTATDLARFECSRDGSSFTTCTSPQDLSSLSAGGHTFAVRGVDASGNVGTAATSSWSVHAGSGSRPGSAGATADTVVSVVVRRAAGSVRPTRLRKVSLARIMCDEAATQACAVTTRLMSTKPIRFGAKRVRVSFGSVTTNVGGGDALTQALRLSAAEVRLVQRLGVIPVTATTVARDEAGNSRTFTMKLLMRP